MKRQRSCLLIVLVGFFLVLAIAKSILETPVSLNKVCSSFRSPLTQTNHKLQAAKSLVRSKLLIGTSSEFVLLCLGNPDFTETLNDGSLKTLYYIGESNGFPSIDYDFLEAVFTDSNALEQLAVVKH